MQVCEEQTLHGILVFKGENRMGVSLLPESLELSEGWQAGDVDGLCGAMGSEEELLG